MAPTSLPLSPCWPLQITTLNPADTVRYRSGLTPHLLGLFSWCGWTHYRCFWCLPCLQEMCVKDWGYSLMWQKCHNRLEISSNDDGASLERMKGLCLLAETSWQIVWSIPEPWLAMEATSGLCRCLHWWGVLACASRWGSLSFSLLTQNVLFWWPELQISPKTSGQAFYPMLDNSALKLLSLIVEELPSMSLKSLS